MIVSPVMELIGLPGSMEFVWATAMLTNLYGVMIVNGFWSMWVIGGMQKFIVHFPDHHCSAAGHRGQINPYPERIDMLFDNGNVRVKFY